MTSVVSFDGEDFAVQEFSDLWSSVLLSVLGILSPLLMPVAVLAEVVGKPFTSRLSALFLPRVMDFIDSRLREVRSQCLKSIRGKVIDVGCAHGAYLRYYSTSAERLRTIIMLEPNVHHNRRLQQNIQRCRAQNPRMKDVEIVIENRFLEDLPSSEDATFDWVVLGNVLCEIPNPAAALDEIDRLLRRGGRVFFCEHIAHEPGSWMRLLQEVLNPWWSRISDGCNLNRCTLHTLRSKGWRMQHWSFMRRSLVPMVVGIAVKDN